MRYRGWWKNWALRLSALALPLLALLGALALGAPAARAQSATSASSARPLHALLVRSDPKADAILASPPSQVKAWFSEGINPYSSELVVIDPSNHEVDTRDSHVSASDPTELIVGLQLLRPGTYIVVWSAQSSDDGHVTGGSFIFRVANADGSVPPVPATLPDTRIPGAAGYGASSGAFDGPAAAQTLFTWLALLFLTFWVGGLIWETWIAPANAATDSAARDGARLAARRFRRLAPYALGGLILADVGLAAALTVEIAGSPRGLFIPQFWRATLFSGQFGSYWWMRQAVAAAALAFTLATRRPALAAPAPATPSSPQPDDTGDVTSWTRELRATLRQVPHLPRRLLRGWLALPLTGQIEMALGLLLLFAFVMSGHAAATPPSERAYAVAVDLLHLFCNAVWLGGLLYISVALIPAAKALPERARALLLARGVPAFSALAIVSVALLTLTGPLDAAVHFTSAAQLITTAYGRTLTVKVEIFLVMVAISAWHAFHLRPRLARALTSEDAIVAPQRLGATVGAGAGETGLAPTSGNAPATEPPAGAAAPLSWRARDLAGRMEDWLRREALLGSGLLLCVALLAAFAGTLAPTQAAAPVNSSAFSQTHTVSGYHIKLDVTPVTFGSNTFTVTVTDPQGKPASDASILIITENLDMDMGQQSLQLQPAGSAQPGVYSGTSDLTMAGHWQVTVKVLTNNASDYLTTQFTLLAGS